MHYQNNGEEQLAELIEAGRVFVDEGTDYDNWNGGTYSHDVLIFVPEEMMGLVHLDHQDQIFEKLKSDLNKAIPEVENEWVRAAFFKSADTTDDQYQASTSFSREPRARPENVGLWTGHALRLFLSHRDTHKSAAKSLAEALEPYGISTFVAHDAIKPMREWQNEIMNGLKTMEVMLVLLTDDFHESVWTNQEIGFALGKGIPIICVKVGSLDPKGFVAPQQALKAPYENIESAAPMIQKALISEIGQEGRLKEILIERFLGSQSYIDAMENLNRLTETADKLTDREFERIVNGYAKNSQLYGCAGIHNRNNWFKRYLESATGKNLEFSGGNILETRIDLANDSPF
jgi:uncharacterized protein YukE